MISPTPPPPVAPASRPTESAPARPGRRLLRRLLGDYSLLAVPVRLGGADVVAHVVAPATALAATFPPTHRKTQKSTQDLASIGTKLYPEEVRLGSTGLIARPEWISSGPLVDLADIEISIAPVEDPPALTARRAPAAYNGDDAD